MKIWKEPFGATEDGQAVSKYFLQNENGTLAVFTDYGATLVSLVFQGTDVVLGYDHLRDYEQQVEYLGATVGRFAGTIPKGCLQMGKETWQLSQNDGENNVHGGVKGFTFRVWRGEILENAVRFSLLSPHEEEGFPGNLQVSVTCCLTETDGLHYIYDGLCDRDTVLNMTSHAYFNLEGHGAGSALNHVLESSAEFYREETPEGLPMTKLFSVKDTPFDFTAPHALGRDLSMPHPQLDPEYGYDRNGYLGESGLWKKAARISAPGSRITMEVMTTQTGMQLYCPGYLLEGHPAKEVGSYCAYGGFCLETQHCLSPREAEQGVLYPVLPAGATYHHETIYQFTRRNGYEK